MEGVGERGINGGGIQMFQSAFVASPSSIPKPHNLGGHDKRIGIPPSYPNNPQIITPRSITRQSSSQNLNHGPSHSRSLSQSAMFSFDWLPPLNPAPYQSPVSNQSDQGGFSHGVSVALANTNMSQINESLPPRRRHRRSMSDSIPLAFSDMIQSSPQLMPIGSQGGFQQSVSGRDSSGLVKPTEFVKRESEWSRDMISSMGGMDERKLEGELVDDLVSAYLNLDNIDKLNSSGTDDKDLDTRTSGTKTNGAESSDNEAESQVKGNPNSVKGARMVEKREGLKRSASGDIEPRTCHYRSLSGDSYMESLKFDGDKKFGNGELNEMELKKILADEKLTEIAMTEPKRAKRILANRLSAARSKERKTLYISELEQKAQTLETETTALSAQVTALQQESASLTSENNGLKFRLQAMEQQGLLKDAIKEQLFAEVQRLRLLSAQLGDALHQLPVSLQMLQLQNQQSAQLSIYQLQHQAQSHQNGEATNQLN